MKLSIIIVNYRSWSFLQDCLASLLSDPDSADWQIIVVDNHSNDGQLEPFSRKFQKVEFLASQTNGGFAYGCNLGAQIASTERLLFLNPDVTVRPGQVQTLVSVKHNQPKAIILTASQLNRKGHAQKTWDIFPNYFTYLKSVKSLLRKVMPGRYPNPRQQQTGLVYCDWVSGAIFMIDRPHFEELGGWCEDYWLYSEDCDLCYLAQLRGWRVACTSEVTFLHHHGGASRQNRQITVITKTEAIISKHLFNHRHRKGFQRVINHCLIVMANVPELCFWTLLDVLTLRRFKVLSIRTSMLRKLITHYGKVLRTGDWRSSRIRDVS